MSKLNISFRDPNSGEFHQVQGEVVQKLVQDNPQSTEELRNDPRDGQVDLFVHMDKNYSGGWSNGHRRESVHLQIDKTNLTDDQAKALAAALRTGKDDAIKVEGSRSFNVMTVQTDLWREKSEIFGAEHHDPSVSLDGQEEGGVFLSEDGVFSVQPGEVSGDLKVAADALYKAAEAGDKLAEGENIFNRNGVSLETKEKTLSNIQDLLGQVSESELTGNEAAQLRSSASTVLTEMMSSLGNEGPEGELKREAFSTFHGLIENETLGALKESMIFNAVRLQAELPDAERDVVAGLRAEIAPTAPPTDKWFADGKRELNVSFAAGHGEGFYEGITEYLGKQGYEVVEEGSTSHWNAKPRRLQMKKQINGEEYTVNVDLRNFHNDSFKDIDNDDYDMVVYQGHSNLGNNTRKSVENAPDATGKDKLIFLGLCAGKDNIDRVREAFPEGQLVTTFNSSYFNTKPSTEGRQFTQGEDMKAVVQIINGSLERASWQEIGDNIRDRAVGYNHEDKTLGNYVTPLDLQLGARFRDIDNDGSAMTMDRHFNVDVLNVKPGVSSSLQPRDNSADGQKLNGELPHTAASFANTIDLYNPTYDKFNHKGRIMADGYFKGQAGDPIVKFETRVEDGKKAYVMQVNEDYAHINEESLRALTMVEYNRHLANTEKYYPVKDGVERELVGLLTAAASLTYDAGYRDAAVFEALADHYDMPEGINWSDAGKLIRDEHHDYTGSVKLARKWMEKLDPSVVEALREKFPN